MATKIAYDNLLACDTEIGLAAGQHHFVDLWARDSLFATLGIIRTADLPVSKKTISTFLRYQRTDGLIPYRIMRSYSTFGKYAGRPILRNIPEAQFRSRQSGGTVADGVSLVVISAAHYVRKSDDRKFLAQQYEPLMRALSWYRNSFGNGLVSEWFQCEWADGVLKSGHVLYTNVLYLKALSEMAYLSEKSGHASDASVYRASYQSLHELFMDEFWNGSYLSDWVDYKKQNYFATHPNFLAVMFDVLNRTQSASVVDTAREHCVMDSAVETNYPAYPVIRIPFTHMLTGMSDYHNRGCVWLQPGITYILALWKIGWKKEAHEFLVRIAGQIVKYHGVYEVYEKSGIPVRRKFYTSENPFAWSAGLFLYAADRVKYNG